MHTKIREVKLDGLKLAVVKVEPPDPEYMPKINRFWPRSAAGFGPYLDAVFAGDMVEYTADMYFFCELESEIIARTACIIPRDTKDLATLGFVHTAPEYRRKGIGSLLLETAINEFEKGGGIAIHLATRNPAAGRLYRKHGFRELGSPGIMRYVREGFGDFESEYYRGTGNASIRDCHWGDYPRLEFLYSVSGHPWLIRDYPRGVWTGDRKDAYENEALDVMFSQEREKGAAVVAHNGKKRVVGCASMIINEVFTGKKSADFDMFVMPEYFGSMPALLDALKRRAARLGIDEIETWVHTGDREKLDAVSAAGFTKRGERMDARLSGEAGIPLELYGFSMERR